MKLKKPFLNRLRNSRATRILCAFLALNLLVEIASPTVAMALTSGPSAPEFASFEPVATTDMVNDFTGDFTYNIPVLNVPGPDGPGYSMSLAYHSGGSSEEEASWVGYGWTLNPGAINRNKRGYPDEFNNVPVTTFNKVKPNWNQSAKFDFNIEPSSNDLAPQAKGNASKGFKKFLKMLKIGNFSTAPSSGSDGDDFPISVSISHTIRFNSYSGFSISKGFSLAEAKGLGSLSMNQSGGENTLGFSVNPLAILSRATDKLLKFGVLNAAKKLGRAADKLNKALNKFSRFQARANRAGVRLPTSYSLRSYNTPALAYSVAKNSGASWNFSASVQVNPTTLPVGFQVGIAGNMNIQIMEGKVNNSAFGYMYSSTANNITNNQLLDFQVENETTFNKHDKNLGIPFNNADVFSATGNDVVGGFRFQQESIGSYYPNPSVSEMKIRQLSFELGIGDPIQIGVDLGVGKQKTKVSGKWPKNPSYSGKEFSSNLPKLRFTNDMGGEVNYNDSYDNLLYATINSNKELDLSNHSLNINPNKNQSSSFVDYTLDAANNNLINGIKITHKDGAKSNYNQAVYTKNEAQLSIGLPKNQDGSYLVTNSLNFDDPMKNKTVVGSKTDQMYASTYLLTSNTTVNYVDLDNNGPSQKDFGGWTKFAYKQAWGGLGQWYRYRSPYNGLSYHNGKTLDVRDQTGSMSSGDKEIYYLKCIETKSHIAFFVTNKTAAATFTANFPIGDYGFLYSNGQPISTVTTNIIGSGTQRNDGLDAKEVDITTGMDLAAESLTAKGTHDLEKLERIVLFAKSDLSIPLTSTYFEYDYSLCQGIPNTLASAGAPAKEKGKLTLKRVWTESNGVNRSRIAPYQFSYEYFNQYSSEIANKYPWAAGYNAMPGSDANQNPFYHPEQLDAWGNYQEDGDKRFDKMQPWLSQKTMSANTTFDPAAWQLKRIQLPSGGEIHVNYEQKDYASVQDKLPMAMVSLLPDNNKNGYKSDESVYCINTDDIDVKPGSINSYSNTLHQYYVVGKNKLYFKVLYNYGGLAAPTLHSQSREYEYVTGYTTVNKVEVQSGKILLFLGDIRGNIPTSLQPALKGKKDKTLPRYVCYQELMTNGGENLGLNAGGLHALAQAATQSTDLNIKTYKDYTFIDEAYSYNPNSFGDGLLLSALTLGIGLENTVNIFLDWISFVVKNVPKQEACRVLNFELSYFKLPVFNAKRGGGIRVKRLLSYDPGISGQTGDATIYGSEYIYENENGSSSGVATNEPGTIREENALLVYLERKKQKFIDKITNGKDTKQFEAMLGESILPSAEVVHSRVVIKNIRDGLSTSGYTINKYFTSKDFPMEVDYSDISKTNDTYKKFNLNLPLGIFNMSTNRAWVTQGYIFKLNDMNGKIASKTNYPGIYDAAAFNSPVNTSSPYTRSNPFRPIGETYFANPSLFKKPTEPSYTSKTTYNYSKPGDQITTLVYDPVNDKMTKAMLNPGAEEDFTVFTSNVHDKVSDFALEVDINIWVYVLGALVVPLFGASFSLTDNLFCQHVTSKVVSQKSYLLSTTTINDGVTQTTENLAFDKYTGDPVFTRTFDGYLAPQEKIYTDGGGATKLNGYYYSLNIPASWMYPSLAPMSQNILNTNQLTTMAGNVVTYSTNTLYNVLLTPTATAVDWSPNGNPLTNVVNASATTFTNNWFDASMANDYPALATPTTVVAVNKFYYPVRTYAYKDNVTDANAATTGRIYKGGTISTPFSFFSWSNPSGVNPKWYSDSKVNKYAPYGYPLEEEDVLAIKSSAKFGYDNTLPVLVAQNAAYAETIFSDFEYGSTNNLNLKTAHSGRASYDLSSNTNYAFVSNYPISSQLLQRGLSIKLWLKSSQSQNISSLFYNLKNPNPQLKAAIGGQLFEFKSIAQTGDWTLYSADISNFNGLAAGNYNVQLSYSYASSNEEVLVDDFRMQPLDASMNCSVYYADNKLAAQFDDQHFGVFYEYNGKGQLVRKSIETERGKKTLQEQQYNTPLINR
jgi:hypothetical protein